MLERILQRGREVQPLRVARQQLVQAGLVDRHLAARADARSWRRRCRRTRPRCRARQSRQRSPDRHSRCRSLRLADERRSSAGKASRWTVRPARATARAGESVRAGGSGGDRLQAEDGMLRRRRAQLLLGRVGPDTVEEHADLGLPALQIGAQDRALLLVCRARVPRTARRGGRAAGGRRPRRAGCAPTVSRRAERRDSCAPSTLSRLTGVRRGSPEVRPRTSSTREPSRLTPERVSIATSGLKT